ncbi:MAG: hypothetical protein HUJ25_07140 [Crocinitomicaceae bacterium]|nr:hypothetical protein [Crocinitomicaceae bacterium]
MSEKNKIIAGWVAFLFVVFHLSAIFIFAAPYQFGWQPAKRFVNPYVTPLFQQDWSMFAPCPYVEGKLRVKIIYEDETTDWFYPNDNAKKWHRYLRFSHHGDLVILETNLMHFVYMDMVELGIEIGEPIPEHLISIYKDTRSWNLIRKYVYGVSKNRSEREPIQIKVIAELHNVITDKSGELELPTFKW